jgi:hypothetical protein
VNVICFIDSGMIHPGTGESTESPFAGGMVQETTVEERK